MIIARIIILIGLCTDSNNIKAPDLEVLPVWLSSFCLLISLLNRENSGSTVTLGGPVNTD